MPVVDTSAWSLALRRPTTIFTPREADIRDALKSFTTTGQAILIGAVRQELLSGIRDIQVFTRQREWLSDMDDEPCSIADHERAAEFSNELRRRGMQPDPVDMLVCAVASRLEMPILTTDPDFERYAAHLPITLHELSRRTQ